MVGVGIEPTFRAFQTRANPSQLSDRSGARGESRTHEYWICNPAPYPLGDARKLERKERFELSSRVWKTRMFPATSLPRGDASQGDPRPVGGVS